MNNWLSHKEWLIESMITSCSITIKRYLKLKAYCLLMLCATSYNSRDTIHSQEA